MAARAISLKPPRQARSRDTLERLAGAAATLLNERPWPQIGVAELAAAAGTSVGAFYARFADKQGLLEYLDERYADELVALFRRHAAYAERNAPDAQRWAERLLRSLVRLFRRYRGLLATVVLEARAGGSPAFAARTRRMNAELPALTDSFLATLPAGTASREEVRAAMAFTFSALREQILFPDAVPAFQGAARRGVSDAALTRALVRNFLGYLGLVQR